MEKKFVFILSGDLVYTCAQVAQQVGVLNKGGFYMATVSKGDVVFKFRNSYEQIYQKGSLKEDVSIN